MSDSTLDPMFETLTQDAPKWRTTRDWPIESLRLCGRNGIFRGLGGVVSPGTEELPWNSSQQIEMFVRLAKADLLTTFVITQHLGAIKRILGSDQLAGGGQAAGQIRQNILPGLLSGAQIASVGISHLTTSRLHLGRPAVMATPTTGGYQLDGTIPWVTGAPNVQHIVVGATLEDATQILVLLSLELEGVKAGPGADMIAMTASCTDAVELNQVIIPNEMVLSGPCESVLAGTSRSSDAPTGAGGLQTSALALGLSFAALDYLRHESTKRHNLVPIVDRFEAEHHSLHETIRAATRGESEFDSGAIRTTANGLVQRTTSAAMTTAKGAGLMIDHPVGRWCQQAFFFLVWSCPQPVAEAHLCELVGLE